VRGLAITTVLDFDDVATFASDGYERAADWLREIQLGMSLQDLWLTGLVRGPAQECQAFDAKNLGGPSNGYVSAANGVVMLRGEPPPWTPEGIGGFGSTRSEVEDAYGELRADSLEDAWRARVPGHSGKSYSFTFDEDGVVVAMALWKDDQDCVG
jgi:hypothetical protein